MTPENTSTASIPSIVPKPIDGTVRSTHDFPSFFHQQLLTRLKVPENDNQASPSISMTHLEKTLTASRPSIIPEVMESINNRTVRTTHAFPRFFKPIEPAFYPQDKRRNSYDAIETVFRYCIPKSFDESDLPSYDSCYVSCEQSRTELPEELSQGKKVVKGFPSELFIRNSDEPVVIAEALEMTRCYGGNRFYGDIRLENLSNHLVTYRVRLIFPNFLNNHL